MEDIPQPSSDPYSVGDHVQIYLSSDDPDNQHHGVVCEIVETHEDNLGGNRSKYGRILLYTV